MVKYVCSNWKLQPKQAPVTRSLEDLIQKGYVSRPSLWVRWQPVTLRVARAYDLTAEWGAFVFNNP
jgi:hypothetical protein